MHTDMVDDAIDYNLDMASDTYETLLRQMPEKQRNVFIAISTEGEARNVNSGAFAKKYRLTSPSSVNSALKGLLEKDFITQQDDAYTVYDKFFDLVAEKAKKLKTDAPHTKGQMKPHRSTEKTTGTPRHFRQRLRVWCA